MEISSNGEKEQGTTAEEEKLRKQLTEAGRENTSTRSIVLQFRSDRIPHHDEILDPDLNLTLLHIAAWTGDQETAEDLQLQGLANPGAKTAGGFTPLHLAASRGHTNVLKTLVTWPGLNIEEAVSDEAFTPLHLAAHGGYTDCAKLLVEAGIDLNATDNIFGRTALHFAAQVGHEQVVHLLLSVPTVEVRCKDNIRELTPFLLAAMQPQHRCNLGLTKLLLDENPEQINDKVGAFRDEISEPLNKYFTEKWRELAGIEIDNSMKRIPGVDEKVDQNEQDLYRKFSISIDGHTALHLASTQNNVQLVSELVHRPKVSLNDRDMEYGMTPLHCAVRTGAMEAFRVLMETEGVDVNAKLVKAGSCRRPWWLPPAWAFAEEDIEDRKLKFLKGFARYDTPLHLAIRASCAKDLCEIMIDFCNHPMLNPAIYNANGTPPLGLAWERLLVCGRSPTILEFRKEVSTNPIRARIEKYQYDDKVFLNHAIDMMERHPANSSIMNEITATRKAAQDSVNSFLVAATLVAGLTFSAYFQPPFGPEPGEYRSKAVRLFWTFNGLSFYFAVYTILCSLLAIMRSDRRSFNTITDTARSHYVALVRIHGAVPLTVSVGFGVGAFVAAGYANSPPKSGRLMLACTITGLLVVLLQLLRNLYIAFTTLNETFLDYVENPTRSDYLFILFLLAGGKLLFIAGNVLFFNYTTRGTNGEQAFGKSGPYHMVSLERTPLFEEVILCFITSLPDVLVGIGKKGGSCHTAILSK
ncbi:hypothetical protein R1sor_024350 [Riccia sorocarpa]|uniref:PGG domain-containing protein n=1 Tax=Riccia sorocarpa TaxID=122646 RepID=A0ABD3GWB9_9MARC